jgi:hypothetical protein
MHRAARRKRPKRARPPSELTRLHGEVIELQQHVMAMRRELREAITPRPEPVDNDPPIGVVAAAELSGKSAKVLRRLIDRGVPIGEYVADRYVVRMGASPRI